MKMNVFLYSPEPAIPARRPVIEAPPSHQKHGNDGSAPISSGKLLGPGLQNHGVPAVFLLTNSYYCVNIRDYARRG
jgi:hypothetical protein